MLSVIVFLLFVWMCDIWHICVKLFTLFHCFLYRVPHLLCRFVDFAHRLNPYRFPHLLYELPHCFRIPSCFVQISSVVGSFSLGFVRKPRRLILDWVAPSGWRWGLKHSTNSCRSYHTTLVAWLCGVRVLNVYMRIRIFRAASPCMAERRLGRKN